MLLHEGVMTGNEKRGITYEKEQEIISYSPFSHSYYDPDSFLCLR